jgi:hypothetical protein
MNWCYKLSGYVEEVMGDLFCHLTHSRKCIPLATSPPRLWRGTGRMFVWDLPNPNRTFHSLIVSRPTPRSKHPLHTLKVCNISSLTPCITFRYMGPVVVVQRWDRRDGDSELLLPTIAMRKLIIHIIAHYKMRYNYFWRYGLLLWSVSPSCWVPIVFWTPFLPQQGVAPWEWSFKARLYVKQWSSVGTFIHCQPMSS